MSNEQLEVIRHSLSHIMARAVFELWPKAKFAIGPAIENGFYYDIDFGENKIDNNDLREIEKKMNFIIKQNLKFEKLEINIDDAFDQENKAGQIYKQELVENLKNEKEVKVSYYKLGNFFDLCRGPHIESTGKIKKGSFKLNKLAGAYWRGDEKNKMLTRIYGVAFETKEELDDHLKMMAEAEKRDHRKLGKELGLFVFSDLVGMGLPLYTHKGFIIRREIIKYVNELQTAIGYEEVHTPNINKAELFKVSGHYDKYKEDMFRVSSNYTKEEYFLKPMSCPQHTQIYAAEMRSYKDLPIRIADFANLYRDEKPGELSGLTRLRCFCQDDGHCFCREDQIKNEFLNVLDAIKKTMITYGMNYKIRLSLWDPKHPEKYLGDAGIWKKSQLLLEEILIENKIDYIKAEGEAAIYGPKMDLISFDSLGRKWQLSTIQLDFIMPQRFKLTYIDSDGKEKTPVMVHRALVGSPERFMGILIEHYAGAFPVWLSPVQAVIIPISEEKFGDYALEVKNKLIEAGIRVEIDMSAESLAKRIREAQKQKVPYMLVVGEKEKDAQSVAVRNRDKGDEGMVRIDEFIKIIKKKILEHQK